MAKKLNKSRQRQLIFEKHEINVPTGWKDKSKRWSQEDIVNIFNGLCDVANRCCWCSTSNQIQESVAKELNDAIDFFRGIKVYAIETNDDKMANLFYYMQCVIAGLGSLCMMWVNLKKNKPEKAWINLIDSQEYISVARRCIEPEHTKNIEKLQDRLYEIEENAFPPMTFNSIGAIFEGGKCSVCGQLYKSCDHLDGFVYCGVLCYVFDKKIVEFNHTAIVKNPRDRRCITRTLETDNHGIRDLLTNQIIEKNQKPTEGLIAESILLTPIPSGLL